MSPERNLWTTAAQVLAPVEFGQRARERQDRGRAARADVDRLVIRARVFEQKEQRAGQIAHTDEVAPLLAILVDQGGLPFLMRAEKTSSRRARVGVVQALARAIDASKTGPPPREFCKPARRSGSISPDPFRLRVNARTEKRLGFRRGDRLRTSPVSGSRISAVAFELLIGAQARRAQRASRSDGDTILRRKCSSNWRRGAFAHPFCH